MTYYKLTRALNRWFYRPVPGTDFIRLSCVAAWRLQTRV